MEYHTRKSIDAWLRNKGYYRKLVALDETCLFRAVSDQVYNTQVYHEDLRKKCVKYAMENREDLKDWLDDFDEHIDKLSNHLTVCGELEIEILSRVLERDFIIFDSADFTIQNATRMGHKELIMLCKMKADHYDPVFRKDYVASEGFCQSLVYKTLYENVFKMDNVDEVVDTMLYAPKETAVEETAAVANVDALDSLPLADSKPTDEDKSSVAVSLEASKVPPEPEETPPPIPYKVAKALDPNQYRNVGFDAWNQEKKDMRMSDWYTGGDDFKPGTKCLVQLHGRSLTCYVQELKCSADDMCLVYIVDTAERVRVNLRDLRPHPHAKPWPKPYASHNKSKLNATADTKSEPKEYKRNHYQRKRQSARPANESWREGSCSSSGYGSQSAASLEGCSFMTSMINQFAGSLHLDDDMSAYPGPPVTFTDPTEPYAHFAANQVVRYGRFDQYAVQSFADQAAGPPLNPGALMAPSPWLDMPLVSPQPQSVLLDGLDLPFYGVECVRQNYWQMCMPPVPHNPMQPVLVPPHVSVDTELNVIHQNATDTMVMFYLQRIKGNPLMRNEYFPEMINPEYKPPMPELFFDGLPPLDPFLNFVPEMPYPAPPSFNMPFQLPDTSVPPPNFTVPPPNLAVPLPDFSVPPPNITVPPPALPLHASYPRLPYPEHPAPYLIPPGLPMPPPIMPYYPIEFVPLPLPPVESKPAAKKVTKRRK